jgi:hypothetical protein
MIISNVILSSEVYIQYAPVGLRLCQFCKSKLVVLWVGLSKVFESSGSVGDCTKGNAAVGCFQAQPDLHVFR